MQRLLLAVALITILAVTAWSQDTGTPDESESEEQVTTQDVAAVADEEEEAIDETGLDDESYADIEDDDFRPSEDIPADQSIPFPTDI